MKIFYLLFILLFIFIPKIVFGEVIVNEIMYDLKEGSDSGREWIEIKNIGNEDIDLSDWKLYEDSTNHSLNLFGDGISSVLPGGYAVIADNAEKFLADWPEFVGVLFDSSFSLKNDGETLIIRDEGLIDADQVDYFSDWGAGGDGNSLQLIGGKWQAKLPTPGLSNDETLTTQKTQSTIETSVSPQISSPSVTEFFPLAPQIYALSSGDETGVAGGVLEFEGLALGLKKEPLLNARFLWNFGDGYSKEGKNVAHTYNHPGDYIVFLDVSSGEYSASSRMNVKITGSNLKISDVKLDPSGESLIELYNDSGSEMDISYWLLRSRGTLFVFPRNSFIGKGNKLTLSSSVTKLNINESKKIDILYPNGSLFYSFNIGYNSNRNNADNVYKENILSLGEVGLSNGNRDKTTNSNDIISGHLIENGYDGLSDKNQEASVISFSNEGKDGKGNKWIFFAGGFGLIGVLGTVFVRRIGSVS